MMNRIAALDETLFCTASEAEVSVISSVLAVRRTVIYNFFNWNNPHSDQMNVNYL